jgi:hypothetical protein
MSITIPIVASPSGAQSTVTLPDPVVSGGTPTTFNFGVSTVLPGTDNGNGNSLLGQKETLTVAATLNSLSFNVIAPAGQLYLGVYDATGPNGGPGSLKATTAVFTPVAGWNTKPVVTSVVLPAGDYWLSYHPSSGTLSFPVGYDGGTICGVSRTFGLLPATFPTVGSFSAAHWSMYATVTSSSAPPSLPTISSVVPNPAPAGPVTINGTNFAVGATVSFGGTPATGVTAVSSTQIACTAPAHADGLVSVTVTTSAGTSSAFTFTYQAGTSAPPTITSISPNPGPAGPVTVNGTNFVAGATVTFGGTAATGVSVVSSTQITCTAPAHANGVVTVVVTTSAGTGSASFTYGAAVSGLPPLWNASPPTGVCGNPSGPIVGDVNNDGGVLATNEIWDHFNGASGSNPDSRLWWEDTINQGGDQIYDPSHGFLDGNSSMVFEATTTGQGAYRSAKMSSRSKFNMQYGWCAARIKFPLNVGFFPAFWQLMVGWGTNPYGEIDMMEFFGPQAEFNTHLYMDNSATLSATKPAPYDPGAGFHTYWMLWQADSIQIGVDDLSMGTFTKSQLAANLQSNWVGYQQPAYCIMNFAVHPSWLPFPTASEFPARMLVDWFWYKPLNLL